MPCDRNIRPARDVRYGARRRPARLVRAFTSGRPMFLASVTMALSAIGFVYAVKTTTAANAAFVASTTPVFGALAARAFLRERLDRVTVVSIVVAFMGPRTTTLVGGGIVFVAIIGRALVDARRARPV